MSALTRTRDLLSAGHIATVTVIALGYFVAIVGYLSERNSPFGASFTAGELAVGIILGVIYTVLSVAGLEWLTPLTPRYAKTIYFLVLIALALTIQFLLIGADGLWLIAMPLVATARTELPPRPRWLVYLAALAGMILPFYLDTGSWRVALLAGLSFSPAIIFVVVFVRLTLAAEASQQEAERLAAELADANRRLAAYAVQAEELATTQERNRLAREIHDSLGHYLTVANVQIQAAGALLDKDPARARAALERAGGLTQEGLAAVRRSVSTLRESPLGRRTLPEAIAALAAETQAVGIVAELAVDGPPRPLPPRVELTLFRAAQEGLTNVRKHAHASRADLCLDYRDPAAVTLTVSDNGPGRGAPAGDGGSGDAPDGFGLLGLRERARQLGGRVETATAPGAGFTLTVVLPTKKEEEE